MQVLQTLSRFLGWPRRPLPGLYADGWQAGTILDEAKSSPGVEGFAALRRGLEILSGQLTATPILVFNGNEEAPESAVARCLRRTSPAHLETAVNDMLATGNGWLKIVDDGNKSPHHLECVQAFRMAAVIEDGAIVYRCDGEKIDYAKFVHLMCRNGNNPFIGDALVESYNASVAAVLSTLSIYRQLQGNGSFADAYISTDMKLNELETKQLRAAYESQTGQSAGKAGGVVLLHSGLKPMAIKRLPSALEADIVKSLDFCVAEASRMTGVPLGLLGVKDAVAYNSAVETFRSFYKVTVRPLMHRVEQELTAKLGATVKYDLGELVLGYGVERADVLGKLMYSGIVTLNEARHTLGYSPAADGDIHGLPSNQIPLHTWLTNGEKPAPQPPAEPPASV